MVTFMTSFLEGAADKFKGFIVHGGGAATQSSSSVDKGGYAVVLTCIKRADGRIENMTQLPSGRWNFTNQDELLSVLLLVMEDNMPDGYTSGSVGFAYALRGPITKSFRARFYGTVSEVSTTRDGEATTSTVPILVWEDGLLNKEP